MSRDGQPTPGRLPAVARCLDVFGQVTIVTPKRLAIVLHFSAYIVDPEYRDVHASGVDAERRVVGVDVEGRTRVAGLDSQAAGVGDEAGSTAGGVTELAVEAGHRVPATLAGGLAAVAVVGEPDDRVAGAEEPPGPVGHDRADVRVVPVGAATEELHVPGRERRTVHDGAPAVVRGARRPDGLVGQEAVTRRHHEPGSCAVLHGHAAGAGATTVGDRRTGPMRGGVAHTGGAAGFALHDFDGVGELGDEAGGDLGGSVGLDDHDAPVQIEVAGVAVLTARGPGSTR